MHGASFYNLQKIASQYLQNYAHRKKSKADHEKNTEKKRGHFVLINIVLIKIGAPYIFAWSL